MGKFLETIREFEIVQALATHRHFGKAAQSLGVSQPSLTRSLSRIEAALGGPLFDRKGVAPTLFGEIVLRHGKIMLGAAASLSREILLTKGLGLGDLSVAAGFYPAEISGHAAAAALSRRHPEIAIDFRILDWPRAKDAVLTGSSDLAFADIRAARDSPEFDVHPVRAGALSFFCSASHPLAKKRDVTFDDLTLYPWAGPSLPPAISSAMPQDERPFCVRDKHEARLRPRILVESFTAAKRIVLEGEALSAGLPFQIASDAGDLVMLPVETPFLSVDYGFILKRDRMISPAAAAFMSIVRDIERGVG
ncbi:LysR family transcriptional regulator [Methylocella sp.]|uniref:LysR family transcriptional regulator n=1 Tax=Methylocella sp. TaxID=1978226 RepID=UPI0037836ACD